MITISGDKWIHKAVWYYIKAIFKENTPIVVVDSANRFDPYFISKLCINMGLNPYLILENIFIARAFTPFQLQELLKKVYSYKLNNKNFYFICLGVTHLLNNDNINQYKKKQLLKKTIFYLHKIGQCIVTINRDRFNMYTFIKKESRLIVENNSIIKPDKFKKEYKKLWAGQLHHLHMY